MARTLSAGVLLFRRRTEIEILIAHMGGPFWARKDERAWSIPKGEYDHREDAFAAARREFEEELGSPPPERGYLELGDHQLPGGKVLSVWAVESDFDADEIRSNTFELVWPPGSGTVRTYPEIDRALWAAPEVARVKLVASQVVFLDRLLVVVDTDR